jgi:hypothetical protein
LKQLTSYHTLKLLENGSLEDGVKFVCNVHHPTPPSHNLEI